MQEASLLEVPGPDSRALASPEARAGIRIVCRFLATLVALPLPTWSAQGFAILQRTCVSLFARPRGGAESNQEAQPGIQLP